MGAELLLVLLPGGALFGLGAAWVVFRASSGRSIWVRSLRVLAMFLGCLLAPIVFFLVFGTLARYTQPSPKVSALAVRVLTSGQACAGRPSTGGQLAVGCSRTKANSSKPTLQPGTQANWSNERAIRVSRDAGASSVSAQSAA
jgi:hypothetical protein